MGGETRLVSRAKTFRGGDVAILEARFYASHDRSFFVLQVSRGGCSGPGAIGSRIGCGPFIVYSDIIRDPVESI